MVCVETAVLHRRKVIALVGGSRTSGWICVGGRFNILVDTEGRVCEDILLGPSSGWLKGKPRLRFPFNVNSSFNP